jgi:hypothetical protein
MSTLSDLLYFFSVDAMTLHSFQDFSPIEYSVMQQYLGLFQIFSTSKSFPTFNFEFTPYLSVKMPLTLWFEAITLLLPKILLNF